MPVGFMVEPLRKVKMGATGYVGGKVARRSSLECAVVATTLATRFSRSNSVTLRKLKLEVSRSANS